MLKKMMAGVVTAGLVGVAGTAHAGKDLDAVKARGQLICGIATGVAGFAQQDDKGKWLGLDIDVCRAVSAAISSAVGAAATIDGASAASFLPHDASASTPSAATIR